MSFPDYDQKCNDHKSLLILVKSINGRNSSTHLSPKVFNKLYERIANLDELCIEDAQGMGCQRLIRLRYKRNEYENENNDWGDFQCHRKLLGLITISKYNGNDADLQDVYAEYQNTVDKYSSTLYDSRCLVFDVKEKQDLPNSCPQTNGDNCESKEQLSTSLTSGGDCVNERLESGNGCENSRQCNDGSDNGSTNDCNTGLVESKLSKQLTQCLIYNCVNSEIDVNLFVDQLEKDVKDLISSLFWVLEAKRMDRSYEKLEKIPLLMAPFETKALIGLDTDSKIFKRKCMGRMRKYMGDLSLLAGLPSEALIHYGNSIDTLRSANDWLWLASALEGQCVASVSLLYPQTMKRRSSLQRNSSLPASKFRKMQEEAANVESKPRSFNRKFLVAGAGSSRSLPNGDPIVAKAMGKFLLNSITEVYERYKEACCHYAKYRNASVVELECSFKASRLLTFHEKYLYASEFIQNAVFISFNQSPDEQIKRLCIISDLYSEIGYNRKSAFYQRFAALKAVAINVQNPNWKQCYHLLLPSLDGYNLTLDPVEYDKRIKQREFGWTGIHLQLLQELVTTAKRMSAEQIAIRHLSFLLHALFEFLTPTQRKDFAKQLETLSQNCGEGAPVPLTLSTGIIIPSVNLTKFPCVTSFKVQNLSPRLNPVQLKSKHRESISSPASPFIFTPLQLSRPSSARRKSATITAQPLNFKWIEGEVGRVLLKVHNYLPIDLSVSHMSLMTDGIAFETNHTSQTLPADSGEVTVELTGIPRSNGKLDILGYATHVLGVKNNCKLKDLTNAKKMKFPHMYTIDVVPPLPFIDIVCSDLETSNNSTTVNSDSLPVVSTFKLSLFAGELKSYTLSMCNKSTNNQMVEIMSVSVQSKLPKNVESEVICWDDEALQSNLPLATDSSFNFTVTINGVSNFVRTAVNQQQRKVSTTSAKFKASSGTASPLHSNYSSPAHKKSNNPNLLGAAFANFISDLQSGANLSNAVKRKHASEPSIIESLDEYPVKSVELTVNIEYSGGAGLTAGYCRKCALMFDIEILPSLIITQWDVLPAERHDNCYLVFDVLNATNQEMELFYATNKSILIEAKETCRIPVPVERCPLIDNEEKSSCVSRDELHSKCKSYLNNQVNLKWLLISFSYLHKFSSNERSGTASIADIPWTSAMLDLILMSSLKWDVSVNEHIMPLTNEQSIYKIGQLISVNVKITNCSGNALRSLCVCLSCYQDFENGNRNYRLDMKRSVIGCDKVYIDEITSKETYAHECSFIFFFTGLYKMDIQCTGLDHCAIDSTKNDDCLRVRSDSSSLKSQSLWKYSPSIEFNIVE